MKFKAEDFKSISLGHYGATPTIEQTAANIANRLLKEWLERAPEEFGVQKTAMGETWIKWGEGIPNMVGPNPNNFPEATHRARIVCIENIEKVNSGEEKK